MRTHCHQIHALLGLGIASVLVDIAYGHLGSCEDHSPLCRPWAALNFCRTSLLFMALNCPVSCNLCLDPGCFDRNRLCPRWAQLGHCHNPEFHTQMEATCPHSCDFCRIPLGDFVNTQSITTPDFECGQPVAASNANINRRRVKRQIIFPDELAEYIRLQQASQRGTMALMRTGSSATSIRINDIMVTDAFCGATLIHERFLLTAAHCVLDPDRPVRTVRLGELDFSKDNEANSMPVDYEVERIIVHPQFKPNSLVRYNDVALIQTVLKVEFNNVVFPFCLSDARPSPKDLVTGSGFGFVNNTDRSSILQEAELNIVESSVCEDQFRKEGLEDVLKANYPELLQGKDILCASYPGRDACQGDSGGPLFQDKPSGRRFLVGVVSQGISCRGNGAPSLPGFYISVADHIDFINSVIYAQ